MKRDLALSITFFYANELDGQDMTLLFLQNNISLLCDELLIMNMFIKVGQCLCGFVFMFIISIPKTEFKASVTS